MMKNEKVPMISSIGGALLHVENLEKMTVWYGKLLNMDVRPFDSRMPFYSFDMKNQVNLTLDDHRNMKSQTNHPIFQVKTRDIEKAYQFIQDRGIPIILDLQHPHEGLAYFNIEDPDRNAIMVCQSDWVNPSPVHQLNPLHPIENLFSNIIVPVKQLKQAAEWYSVFLGLPIKPERSNGGPVYWFDMENGTGILLDDNRNNQDLPSYPTFMLTARDIQEAYRFVKQNEIPVVRDIQYDQYFMIKDPENHTIMICL